MKSWINRITILAVLLLFFTSVIRGQEWDYNAVSHNINQRIAEGNVAGVVVAYISPDGSVSYLTKGTLSMGGNQPVDRHSIFEIGSVTKTFTALILAQIVEEGALTLDTPIKQLLPDEVGVPDFEEKSITLEHLATHTSGLPRLPHNMSPEDPANPYADYTVRQMYEFLRGYELTRAPGSEFAYSNLGMGLLGHILELTTDMSYEKLIQDYITQPLAMRSTGITISNRSITRFARPYSYKGEAKNWDLPTLAGAGALRSTASDMVTYMKVQMGIGQSTLAKAAQTTQAIRFKVDDPAIDYIGLAWIYSTLHDTLIWHSGGTGGYRSFAGYNKEKETGVVVLSNGTQEVTDIGFHLLDDKHNLREVEKAVSVDPEVLSNYTGYYESDAGHAFYVTKQDSQLWVQLEGQTKVRVYPESEKRFFYKVVSAEIEFETASGGEAVALTLFQNGAEIKAEKISKEIPEKTIPEEIEIDPVLLDRYTGMYSITADFVITVSKEGDQLMIQATGQPRFPVYPESKTKFFLKVVDAWVEFIEGDEGQFNKLRLYQSGQVLEGKRTDEGQ